MKTLMNDTNAGCFSETAIIDTSGIYSRYGTPQLYGGINYYSNVLGNGMGYDIGDDNDDGGDGEGSGNFTGTPYPKYRKAQLHLQPLEIYDERYLEDMINIQPATTCSSKYGSKKIVGTSCDVPSLNPHEPFYRSLAGTTLKYNDDISDPIFNTIQLKDGSLFIPSSMAYNNIVPAMPKYR
jgi:hypothetical protein